MGTNINYSLLSVSSSPFSNIPVDVFPIIFKDVLPSEVDQVALVCKSWQKFADSQEFRDAFHPQRAVGIKELKTENPNIVDAGIELLLPRCAYRECAEEGVWFVFDPGKVKIKNGDEQIVEVTPNALARDKLCNVGLTDSCEPILNEEQKEKPPRWLRIDTKALDFSLD